MPRIDVAELRQCASELTAKSEDVRSSTSRISTLFNDLADNGGWNDVRYSAFLRLFEEKTLRTEEFAERIGRYAEWLQRLADDVEERWGETMNVS